MGFANMSGTLMDERRKEGANKAGASSYVIKKYRGLPMHKRAIQAALDASNDGQCWWVYDYVRRSILGDKVS